MASKLTARKVETAKPGKDREKDAKLIALACSKPPKGRARWTLRLLEKKSWNFHCRSRQTVLVLLLERVIGGKRSVHR